MNYISYIKRKGFKKCEPFSVTGDLDFTINKFYKTIKCTPSYIEDGELVFDGLSVDISVVKGYKLYKLDTKTMEYKVESMVKWNHLKYINTFNEDDSVYVTIHKPKDIYGIMLTNTKFSFVHHKVFPLINLEKDLFDDNLKSTIGNYRFREFTINSLLSK